MSAPASSALAVSTPHRTPVLIASERAGDSCERRIATERNDRGAAPMAGSAQRFIRPLASQGRHPAGRSGSSAQTPSPAGGRRGGGLLRTESDVRLARQWTRRGHERRTQLEPEMLGGKTAHRSLSLPGSDAAEAEPAAAEGSGLAASPPAADSASPVAGNAPASAGSVRSISASCW